MGLMGVDVRGIFGGTVAPTDNDATLSKRTQTGRTPGRAAEGTNLVFDDYPCKAYVKKYGLEEIDGDRIQAEDRLIGIYAEGLVDDDGNYIVPSDGDQITLMEPGFEPMTYTLIGMPDGGAGAGHYVIQGRRGGG